MRFMTLQLALSGALFGGGILAFAMAVRHERAMQRHRQPGVTYRAVTLRRDGGWRRADLFTPEGLVYQRQASRSALFGVVLWILALGVWLILASR